MAPHEVTPETVIHRSPDLLTSEIDGEVVMLSIARGSYFGLDEVGSRIWDLLEKPIPVGRLVARLLEEYEVEPDRCRAETLSFLESLLDRGIVVRTDG